MKLNERDATEVERDLYAHALSNIANGFWNVGRPEPITVQEYAKGILGSADLQSGRTVAA